MMLYSNSKMVFRKELERKFSLPVGRNEESSCCEFEGFKTFQYYTYVVWYMEIYVKVFKI
jgi:hypothetical protein